MKIKVRNSKINSHKYNNNVTNNAIEDIISPFVRIKAFIVDMFMIMMPIMYVTTYILLSGKNDFQGNDLAKWLTALIFAITIIVFWKLKGQSPGLKAYDIKIVDQISKQNISWVQAINRYFVFALSAISIVGLFVPFFRKDKKTLQDLIAHTTIINTNI